MRHAQHATIILIVILLALFGSHHQTTTFAAPPRTPTPTIPTSNSGSLSFFLRLPILLGRALASTHAPEYPVTEIPLAGPIVSSDAELSGLAWYGDYLILMPQYPGRFANRNNGTLFALPKTEIQAFLNGTLPGPLTPRPIPYFASGLSSSISNFEGYEAIEFVGDRVFMTIESSGGNPMMGYLVSGRIAPDLSEIRMDTSTLREVPPAANHSNMTDETIIATPNRILTLYEVNGVRYNPDPVVQRFDLANNPVGTRPFPSIEYRITDATELDADNHFWAINIYWRGDAAWNPIPDPLAVQYGQGLTHSRYQHVERLIEFQLTDNGIERVDTPPIQLRLLEEGRNWEGIAHLDDQGFLLVSDKVPRTILGFVPEP